MTDEQRKKMLESKKGKSDTKSDRNVKKTVGTGPNNHMGTNYVLRAGRTGLNNARLNAEEGEVKKVSKKTGKKTVRPAVVIFILLLIAAGLVTYSILTNKVYKSAAGTIGNTAGNLYNGGLFCENGGRIYFSNPNDDYTLYSMNLEFGDYKKLYNDYARYINVDENYVFYTRKNNMKENPTQSVFIFYSTGVFRIRKNGTNLQMISSDPSGSLLLYDNQLYYQVYKDNALTLHRIDIDKENDKKLFSDDTPVVSVFDGRLYYSGALSDQNIHYLNPNGNQTVAIETKAYLPIAMEEGIFYISTQNGYNIYLADYEDKERKLIVNRPCSWYNITSDGRYVFYNCDEKDDSAIYMLDRENEEETKILEGNFKWLNIAGGYCFFFDFFNEKAYAYDYANKKLSNFDPQVKK